jgi:nucleoside-diphosphate-sugar epimerase
MKVLIVGGTGPIGGHAALHLKSEGHDVVISSRNPPKPGTGLEDLEWMRGNYQDNTYGAEDLAVFDAIVFAAGSDLRHVPPGKDADTHFLKANGELVPAFAELAKRAGVSTFVHIGSFYPQVLPEKIETDAYVRSRNLADRGICALSDDSFRAMSLNAPFVVGAPAGMKSEMFAAYIGYARNLYPQIKPFGPAGATNFISTRSLSEAISGALDRGVGGTSYLIGDENLSFADYFKIFFDAVGNRVEVPSLDKEHPMLPDYAIIQGRGNVISYEPDPEETRLLGYRRNDIAPTVADLVADLDRQLGVIEPVNLGTNAGTVGEFRRLADIYAQAADTRDAALLDSIITDDIVVEGPGFRLEGRKDVLGIAEALGQYYVKTQHVVSQQLGEISGGSGIAETYCTANHILFPEEGKPDRGMTWNIRYQDRFSQMDGSWRFMRRSLIVDWMEVREISLPLS